MVEKLLKCPKHESVLFKVQKPFSNIISVCFILFTDFVCIYVGSSQLIYSNIMCDKGFDFFF